MPKKNKKYKLFLIESPGKIKTLEKILGPDYVVRASYGHIMELSTKGQSNFGVDIKNNFKAHYILISDKKDKLQAIIDAASNASEILIASDNDREGECIGFHLKDCLESTGVPIKRVRYTEITKSAIEKALSNPEELDQNLYDAQQARRIIDRIVGFSTSPYVSSAFNDKLSAGRVQSVATRLVIEREDEIINFKPEEYWNIFATLAKSENSDKFEAKYIKKITNKIDALKIKNDLESDTFKVISVEAKEKKRNPYPPLTTSKLQQVAAGRYGFSVSDTMKIAQELYEAGHITYMRTDSVKSSPESIAEVREWLKNNGHKIPSKSNFYASKASAQEAHEAIRPTHLENIPDDIFINPEQKKLYRIIWERFVASQMEPAIYDTVTILIKSSSNHELKVAGRTLKYAGWLTIATDQLSVKSEEEDDIQLPILKSGDDLILVSPKIKAEQKFTQPPPRYGEAILVKELEKRGIGRPSTYATIINTIKNKQYVELKNKVYHGTELGKKVTDNLKKYFKFLEYDYTANMENELDVISEGKIKYYDMLNYFYDSFKNDLNKAYSNLNNDPIYICDKCSKTMVLLTGKFGHYLKCLDENCKNTISCQIINEKPVIKNKKQAYLGVECPKCKGQMYLNTGKYGDYLSCFDKKCKTNMKLKLSNV